VERIRAEVVRHVSPAILETVLAGLNVDRGLRDAIVGDLLEERAELAAVHGERIADRWMRQQIFRSVPVFVQAAVRNGGFRLLATIVAAALAALLAITLLIGTSAALLSALVSPETIGRLAVVALAIDLACGGAGGYLAARLGRAAPLGAALVFGVLGVSLTLMSGWDAHAWYRPALQLLLIPATLVGGWLRASHLARRAHPA
jgi:hypothetical protein